jgi:mono/diheme cytochrome c family protein
MDAFSRAALVAAMLLMLAAATSCERGQAVDTGQKEVVSGATAGGIRLVASAATSVAISAAARAEAESIYGERCVACHGDSGDGNGPGAANLNPKPENFHNRNWQHATSDEQIAKAIVHGGQSVGLSASMAPNPDLASKPDVVAALVERIRKLGK